MGGVYDTRFRGVQGRQLPVARTAEKHVARVRSAASHDERSGSGVTCAPHPCVEFLVKPSVPVMSSDPEIDRLSHVRPASWENPPPRPRYDLVVLGGGSAGIAAAIAAAERGATVAVIERQHLGGHARNTGPLVLRALAAAAGVGEPGDFAGIQQRMRQARARLAPAVGAPRLNGLGIDVFFGEGRFGGPKTIEVSGTWLTFEHALVATGVRAAVPAIPGLESVKVILADTLVELRRVPERLVVLGGDPLALEIAQTLRRLGTEVSIVGRTTRLVEDEQVDAVLRQAFEKDGIELYLGQAIERVEQVGEDVRVHLTGGDAVEGDRLVLASGWLRTTDVLNLRSVGLESLSVDGRLRTSTKNVWAAGSVVTGLRGMHHSEALGRLVVENALGGGKREASSVTETRVLSTRPEVVELGPTRAERERERMKTETLRCELGTLERCIVEGEETGFVTLHLEQGTERIVAATVVGTAASEVVAPLAFAHARGLGLESFLDLELPPSSRAAVWKQLAAQRATKARPSSLGGRLRALVERK